jgi:hypothetical protein
MKKNNIVQSFKSGWTLGLSDGNRVLVQSPAGDVVEPYDGPCHQLLGLARGDEVIHITDPEVCVAVRNLWKKKAEAYEKALAAGDVDPVDGDLAESETSRSEFADEEDAPTLADLGFGGSLPPRVANY